MVLLPWKSSLLRKIEMEEASSSENPEPTTTVEQDAAAEARFIAQYVKLTGVSTSQARNVYMYSDIVKQRDPYCYRLE